MIVTDLTAQEKNKERCNVFIDGEYAFSLPLEIVVLNKIKKNSELSAEEIEELKKEAEKSFALKRATDYVLKYFKTKKQVREYLIKKGFSFESADYAILKLSDYGYIDDKAFARQYIESVCTKEGARLSDYKLMKKGISKKVLDEVRAENEFETSAGARITAEKYLKNMDKTRENLSKAFRYLIGKGFSYEETENALSVFKGEDD